MCSYAFAATARSAGTSRRTWVRGQPAKTNADFYLQIGFAAAAGNLNAGATAEFGLGFHKNDFRRTTRSRTTTRTTARLRSRRRPRSPSTASASLVYGTEPL